jgi:lipid A 3-O-deacylase
VLARVAVSLAAAIATYKMPRQQPFGGMGVGRRTIGRGAAPMVLAGALAAVTGMLATPAAAQVTFGSPGDPTRVALGAGAFDITPSPSHKDAETAGEFRGEYRFPDTFSVVAPFVGASVTTDGAAYGYFGLGVDINFGPNWVLTPNAAAGVFERGSGTRLGSWWEFRTGAEFAYRFADLSRIGIAVHHTSNAGLTKINPGEQSVLLMYSIPVR